MSQTLGKMIKLFLILLLSSLAFADVKVSVNPPAVYKGDIVQLTITANGDNIEFPQITQIGDSSIIGTSSSQSVSIINGSMSKTISKTYSFRVTKSLKVPSFVVKVDGKEIETKEQSVSMVKPTASHAGQPFVLEVNIDKNISYVGEPINLTLSFKSKLNAHADKIQLGEPKLENFWVKKSDKVTKSTEGDYIVQSINYKLFPQKSGEYTIPAIEVLVGKLKRQRNRTGGFFNDPFFNSITQQLSWQKIYSNNLKIKVNPLPNGLELFGEYSIKASVDKPKIHTNKPVNLTLTVQGTGNIDDVKKFELEVNNVIVYTDEPKIRAGEQNGIYGGVFTQKIALIADQNFTIPSMNLNYFDKESQSVKTVKTEPIDIEVTGGEVGVKAQPSIEVSPSQKIEVPKERVETIKTKVITKTEDAYLKYLFLGVGFLLGTGAMLLVNILKNSKETKKETNIVKAIRKVKDDQALFNLLLPYSKKDKRISKALNLLEENLYKSGNNKIDKEELMEVFEEV